MTLSQSLSLLLLVLVFRLNGSSAAEDEVRSLLEFKKGIKNDPLGKIFSSWSQTGLSDPSACPKSFHGVVCDDNSDSVVSVSLDGLGLVGDLKFSTLNGLKQLRVLSLSGNSFTGRVVPALGSMLTLQHLDLSGNQFYGPIPARINELWGLNYLNLSNNNFTFGYPSGISNLQQLRVLDLHNNGLWGDIGELFLELKYIEHLDLSNNSFFGSLPTNPDNVSFGSTIQVINLSHNNLGGGFFPGKLLETFGNLQVLDLGNNAIMGELPSFRLLYNLRVLRLGNNQLYGLIPDELLQGTGPLEELDLSGNGFSGSIPIVNSTKLSVLNISSNHLLGSLPSSVGNCAVVDLSRNMLHDDISVIESWEANLEIIDLSSNRLTGNIPNMTSQFQRLTSLNLGNNYLEGTLPSVLGTSPRLVKLDLSTNKLGGPIPSTFFTSTTLMNLNISGNHLSGSIPLEGSHASELLVQSPYPALESLDLSENTLTGNLSSAIGNLRRLQVLKLAKNQLSGMLPSELGDLRSLEFLDISNNNFNGMIPENLSSNLRVFNVSNNELSGAIPDNLRNFNESSFHPGNSNLIIPNNWPHDNNSDPDQTSQHHHNSKSSIRVAIILASVGAALMIGVVLLAYHRERFQDFHLPSGFSGQPAGRDVKLGRFSRPAIFKFHGSSEPPPTSLSFSNDHLLTANSRSLSRQIESGTEIVEHVFPEGVAAVSASTHLGTVGNHPATSGRRSSPGSPVASSPRFIDTVEQPVTLDVYSPDRLAGELFFLDGSLSFTAEELSRAPAEVLGRSSHGTLYKATLNSGHVLTVKWLRVGLVKNKKEFAKEVRKIGSIRHPNAVPLRAYYWGPREQERLILADYIPGDSLALHLYGSFGEWKGVLIRNMGFLLDMMTLLMALAHYVHIWWLHGMAFHLVDAVLFLNIRALLSAIVKRVKGFIKLRIALGTLHGALPDATLEELQTFDDECAICREPMAKAKKLSCNHLFHLACLRSWLDQGLTENYSCPTCRKPLFIGRSENEVNPQTTDVRGDELLAREMSMGLDQLNLPGHALQNEASRNQMHNSLESSDWRGSGIDSGWLGLDGAGPSTGIRSAGLGRVQTVMRHLAAVGETYAQTALEDAAWNLWSMRASQAGTSSSAIPPAGSVRHVGGAGGLHLRTTSRATNNNIPNIHTMVETVREVLPHIPDEIIFEDLQRTHSVTVTVNNLLHM